MRKTPLRRKTPLKRTGFKKKTYADAINHVKTYVPADKPKKRIPQKSVRRAREERAYSKEIDAFLKEHPICPVTGGATTQIHHSARRNGKWLLLKRYWIAVSLLGHKWIEENGKDAEKIGLMVRINETYAVHVAKLIEAGVDLDKPIYYERTT